MCLYVYYHGNNLHRFGFVRGGLPTEEERNKGLKYNDLLDMMSEEDREFFKDSGFSEYEHIESRVNIKQQIENRGLVGSDELRKSVDGDVRERVDILSRMSPYERRVYEEMRQAEIESAHFNKVHGLQKNYEMMNDDIEDEYIDLSFFDDLNE